MAVPGAAQTLAPFVPTPLLEASGRWAPPEAVPSSSGAEDVALALADVSGFTALAAALAASGGAAGAERLSAELNRIFGGLLDLVEEHGGLPVASAGDSLLAAWPAWRSGNDTDAALAAATAFGHAAVARFGA